MGNTHSQPAVQHIPIKLCSDCGTPALGGYDYCVLHLQEAENPYMKDASWEYGDRELDWLIEEVCAEAN